MGRGKKYQPEQSGGPSGQIEVAVATLRMDKLVLKDVAVGKLLSPERRRSAVDRAQQEHGLTERRACRL